MGGEESYVKYTEDDSYNLENTCGKSFSFEPIDVKIHETHKLIDCIGDIDICSGVFWF